MPWPSDKTQQPDYSEAAWLYQRDELAAAIYATPPGSIRAPEHRSDTPAFEAAISYGSIEATTAAEIELIAIVAAASRGEDLQAVRDRAEAWINAACERYAYATESDRRMLMESDA